MKNTTKISLMSGLIFAGMALGGIHIANAQNNVNPEIDNSRYTVMIPSEVNIDKNTGKGSFAVTGKVKAQSTIDVSIQSKNGYKLKDKNGELPYNIDKKSFSIDNSRSASDIPLNEEFNIVSKTNTKVSGYYTDSLTFDITSESYKYRLDVNGNLNDNGIGNGRLDDFGRFDVYLNGKLVKENAEDFCEIIPYGTTWEIKNIRSLDGYRYKESSDIRTKGVAGDVVEWEGDLLGDTSIYRITYVNLKFYSNKLTINYHADGAQSWKTANVNNASEIDVTGKDIMETEALKYDELYSEDAEKQHFCSIARIKRDGYTAKANTWKVGQNGSLEVQDNKILQKAQDVAKYCGVLNEFKKNDLTIDLFPIWSADEHSFTIAHWLRLNKAGNGNNDEWKDCYNLGYSSHMIKSDATFIFDSSLAKKIPNGCYLDGDMIIFRDNTSGDYITKSLPYEFTQLAEANSGGQYYYVPYKYQITYDLNGGMENSNKNPSTYTVLDGISLAKPKRIGYTFDGWYDENGNKLTGINEGCTDKFKSIDDVYTQLEKRKTGDIKLTAHWKKYANQYVACFHSNGGQLNIIDDSITNFGNDSNNGFVDVIYTLNASWYWRLGVQANKTGYRCIGYYDAPEGGTKVFDYKYLNEIKGYAGLAVANPKYFDESYRWIYENDLELYPHWEAVVSN